MNIIPILKEGILKLTLDGRFDTLGAGPVQQVLDSYFNQHPKFIIMDMSSVDFISSAGIRVLLITAKEVEARKGILALVGLNPYCRELITTTHIAGMLSQFDTVDQAEAFCRGNIGMADRIVVMKDGIIQQVATPLELYDYPANLFVAGFIGTPPMNFFKGHIHGIGDKLEFDGGSFRVAVPEAMRVIVGKFKDKAIVLGIRPEHVGSPIADADSSAVRIPAVVEITEPMGAETYVHLKTGEHVFIAKSDPHCAGKMDETVSVTLMPSKFHFFNLESSTRIA